MTIITKLVSFAQRVIPLLLLTMTFISFYYLAPMLNDVRPQRCFRKLISAKWRWYPAEPPPTKYHFQIIFCLSHWFWNLLFWRTFFWTFSVFKIAWLRHKTCLDSNYKSKNGFISFLERFTQLNRSPKFCKFSYHLSFLAFPR